MLGIYDIYETDGATPAATMGMGNPQPANTDGTVGSEPLDGCCTAKCKKEKKKKKVDEGIMDRREVATAKQREINQIVRFILDQPEMVVQEKVYDEVYNALCNAISLHPDGTFDLDVKVYESLTQHGQIDHLFVPKTGIPQWFKLRNVYNAKNGYVIYTHTSDLSALDLTVWEREHDKGYGDLGISCKKTSEDCIQFGQIHCFNFVINSPWHNAIMFKKEPTLITADFSKCKNLVTIYGDISDAICSVSLNEKFIKNYLYEKGFVSYGTSINITKK